MQTIKLNLIPGSVLPVVNVSQYDVNRQFALSVYEGAASYSLSGKSVEIRGTKPDGNGFAYDQTDGVVSVSGNTVTISTKEQMTAVGGQTMAELRITSGTTILGTLNFVLDVEPSALSDDTPISGTEIPAIERQLEEIVESLEVSAEDAEAWAVGERDGEPVPSSDPTYHNNAKYYASNALSSASTATTKAGEAATSATNAGNSATTASNAATTATTKAGEASTSATNAGNSATAAAADSLEAEGWAVGEQGGTPVGPTSPYYQNNAAYYAAQAGQYATGGLIFKGSVAFANIPTTGMVNGDMYNITDDFTTDSRFIEGAGVAVKAGADIAFVAGSVNKWDILALGGGGGADALDDLTDVELTSPAEGDLLQYNSRSGKWENSADVPNTMAITGAHQLFKIYDLDVQKTRNLSGTWSGNVYTLNGGVWTFNADKSITASGTPTEGSSFIIAGELPAAVVRLKNPSAATNTRYGVFVLRNANGSAVTSFNYADVPHDAEIIEDLSSYSFSFVTLEIKRSQNNVAMNNTGIPLATIPSDKSNVYAQYAETNTVLTQKVAGLQKTGCENVLPNYLTSQVVSGATLTVNNDGTITANSSSTLASNVIVNMLVRYNVGAGNTHFLPNGIYKLLGSNNSRIHLSAFITKNGAYTSLAETNSGEGAVFTVNGDDSSSDGAYVGVSFQIDRGDAISNVVIKPMITPDLSATYSDYQPYSMTNRELTEAVTPVKLNPSLNTSYFNNPTALKVYRCGNIVNVTLYARTSAQIPNANVYLTTGAAFPTPVVETDPLGFAYDLDNKAILGQVRIMNGDLNFPFNPVVPVDTSFRINLTYFCQ